MSTITKIDAQGLRQKVISGAIFQAAGEPQETNVVCVASVTGDVIGGGGAQNANKNSLTVLQIAPSLPISHFLSLLGWLNKLVVRGKPRLID